MKNAEQGQGMAGDEWPILAHEKTPATVGGPLNEGSLRV